MNELEKINERIFESIKHIDDDGNEYWYARELMIALKYSNWQNFEKVINKVVNSCITSNNMVQNHFIDK